MSTNAYQTNKYQNNTHYQFHNLSQKFQQTHCKQQKKKLTFSTGSTKFQDNPSGNKLTTASPTWSNKKLELKMEEHGRDTTSPPKSQSFPSLSIHNGRVKETSQQKTRFSTTKSKIEKVKQNNQKLLWLRLRFLAETYVWKEREDVKVCHCWHNNMVSMSCLFI